MYQFLQNAEIEINKWINGYHCIQHLMMKGSCFQPTSLFNLINEVMEESQTLNEITNAMAGKSLVIVKVPLTMKHSFAVTIIYILYYFTYKGVDGLSFCFFSPYSIGRILHFHFKQLLLKLIFFCTFIYTNLLNWIQILKQSFFFKVWSVCNKCSYSPMALQWHKHLHLV